MTVCKHCGAIGGNHKAACTQWATTFNRCPARREDWSRCDLRRDHDGDHLLERGIGGNWPWSTKWTDVPFPPGQVQP